MKIPLEWLGERVSLPEGGSLAEALTRAGLESTMETSPTVPQGIVTARVLSCERHPNADRLSVCRVDAGNGAPVTVVCGAPNVAAGQVGALAVPGTVLGDLEVGARKVRGVESMGMLCSERELGFSEDHTGILVLPEGTPIGRPLAEVLPRRDVLVTEPTSNRGDCMSVAGVAREVAAVGGVALKPRSRRALPAVEAGPFSVTIEDPAECPRYAIRIVEGLVPGPSPAWLCDRLEAAGVRPLLNLVDVTNYVLLELGHPLHAFDLDRLNSKTISVRRARGGERLVTLDGKERELGEEVLAITDGKVPVALAGIMGGEPTRVTERTSRILLEGASFAPSRVRAGSRRLGLSTDASARFERLVDPDGVPEALDRAVELLLEVSPNARLVHAVDAYPAPTRTRRVTLRRRTLARILGTELPAPEVRSLLERLGLVVEESADAWNAVVPTFRPDLAAEEDLVEEVARLHGYDRIPEHARVHAAAAPVAAPGIDAQRRARRILLSLGLTEVVTPALVDSSREAALTEPSGFFAAPVAVRNPLSADRDALRGSLLPSLLAVLATNRARASSDLAIFEVSRAYAQRSDGRVDERLRAGILLAGKALNAPRMLDVKFCDFFDMKGLLEVYVEQFWGASLRLGGDVPALLAPGVSCAAIVDGERVGFFGEPARAVRRMWDLPAEFPVFLAELDLAARVHADDTHEFRPLPRFPGASRDLAFVAPPAVRHEDLVREIGAAGGELLEECRLFDVYEGAPLGPGERSLAFTLVFRAPDRSLTNEEVDERVARVVERVSKVLGARIR